jgi:hypothetical protein
MESILKNPMVAGAGAVILGLIVYNYGKSKGWPFFI